MKAIDVKDLPPEYQAQALHKYLARQNLTQQVKQGRLDPPTSGEQGKASKYHNSPTERVTASGAILRFDSKKEASRYDQLIELEQAGQIRDLRLQVDFTLQEAYTDTEGRRVRAIRYRADFTYRRRPLYWTGYESQCPDDAWILEVEDVKSRGTRTKEYLLKRKLLMDRLGIDITEV